ncbi:retrovirus-related pol polyprotein from transposon TNT 1-94 [Tanacetum coccineum]
MKVEESLNVTFEETPSSSKTSPLEDDDLVKEETIEVSKTRPLENNLEDNSLENNKIINIRETKSPPLENVIVPNPMDTTIIGTKWIFRNKLDENGVVSRNKARLVAQGYNQQEGIDYDETYAPVARLESIRILLAYACALDFKLFQMDVKSAFLNGFINEEVYVAQPPGFIDFAKPNHVYRLKKALYGLKQAPKACHEYLNDLEEEYQARALLAKSKRFFKKGTQRFSSAKATDQTECHKCGKKGYFARDCLSKASVPSYQSPFQPKPLSSSQHKPELRPTKDFEAKYNKVKARLALLSSSASASKAATLKNKVLMALAKENDAISKEGARNDEWVKISMRKKRILGVDQPTEDPSSSRKKDLAFVISSADDTKVSILGFERPWLSEAEGVILPNHDTDRILSAESQRNTTDPSVAVTDSSATEYDSVDESSVCSTPLPLLNKLDGAEPISGSKNIKSILKSKSTFKAETLKGVKINEPSSAHAKGNKSSSASKVNSAPAGKLKSVKIKDDPPLAIVIKELNDLRLQISKNQSSYSRNNQQVLQNALQNK